MGPVVAMRRALARWYAPRRTGYPWRAGDPDAYAVLVSEVMLQQTQAARVEPAFERFLAEFPTVEALAAAPRASVLRAWAGLGYNRRGVALSEAARMIVRNHDGRVPADPAALRRLPGVGPYTAAAVASLAYGAPVPAIDVNVARVVARAVLGAEPGAVRPAEVRAAAGRFLDRRDPGGWNQALMDLGREVCRPRPRCEACPLARGCVLVAARRVFGPDRPPGPPSTPVPPRRRQPPFDGSFRQVRGRVVAVLRHIPWATLAGLAEATGRSLGDAAAAVVALTADGVVEADPAARAGRPWGRVRLAEADRAAGGSAG